jgi:hypothetical protein
VLESGEAGAKYHAVAEEGVEMRAIANVISGILAVAVKSLSPDEARHHFGSLSMFVSEDMPASAIETKKKVQWQSTGLRLSLISSGQLVTRSWPNRRAEADVRDGSDMTH